MNNRCSTSSRSKSARCTVIAMTMLLAACGEPAHIAITATEIELPARPGSGLPHLAKTTNDTIVLSWVEPDNDNSALRYSVLDQNQWRETRTVAAGSDWFVNWADFPSVTPISGSLWASHWLVKRPGGSYAYDVAFSLSIDEGKTWGDAVTPHIDNTPTEHGFVSLFPWQSGVGALWLDGRNMTQSDHDKMIHSDGHGMTLRSVVVSPGGDLKSAQLVDGLVCDCCQTDVALAESGPIAVYRNRTSDELRDIYVARAIDDQWQNPRPVGDDGWHIAGCPVNGPAIDALGNHVAVAWFTAAENAPTVRLAFSTDNAESLGEPIDVIAKNPLGRVDVVLIDEKNAVVSWLNHATDGIAEIQIRQVSRDTGVGPVRIIARTGAGRQSGFPQMIAYDSNLLFAWTDTTGDQSRVRTATIPVNDAIDQRISR